MCFLVDIVLFTVLMPALITPIVRLHGVSKVLDISTVQTAIVNNKSMANHQRKYYN